MSTETRNPQQERSGAHQAETRGEDVEEEADGVVGADSALGTEVALPIYHFDSELDEYSTPPRSRWPWPFVWRRIVCLDPSEHDKSGTRPCGTI